MELEKIIIGIGEVKDRKFTQIKYADWGYIYEVDSGDRIHYEVFEKRINRRFGNIQYPKSKAFGKWAWTCMNIGKAKDRFDEIGEKYMIAQAETSNLRSA